jgi:hypothetical protein
LRYADLHLHTYHSDGTRSPREVIDLAREHGITIVAISDHDNVAAYFEIKPYANECGVALVAATELSCIVDGHDVHILAYAFDATDERFEQRLRHFRATREKRGAQMVEKLRTLGYPIELRRVEQLAAGGAMGRPHVARALVEAGYVESVSDAFDKLLRSGKPAFIDKERFRVDEAVALVHSVGGVTSIAHPTLYPNHEELVPRLLDAGVDAVEVFHPKVDAASADRYASIARFRGKFVTGGSDDHGMAKEMQTLGTVRVPETLLGPILERL